LTPRRADSSSAECRLLRASSVARSTLTGLVEPSDLRQDVADAGRLDDGAHGAAGDDAGALRGGLEQDRAGPELLAHLVRDGGADHRDLDEVLLRVLDALADRLGHLAGLAQADADMARAVTDDDDRAEAEAAAALDDLGHAVDLDDALLERELVRVDPGHRWLLPI
jgi:hypothetical protein